jgi:hypothetical protein
MEMVEKYLGSVRDRDFEPLGDKGSVEIHELLTPLYKSFNGGLFWGGALLIRPSRSSPSNVRSIVEWNDASLWKAGYGERCRDVVFFAEDTFGGQFGATHDEIVQFDPETAEFSSVARTAEGWLKKITSDPKFFTGFPVLEAWENMNGRLPLAWRLMPKQFFVLGGEFHSNNMIARHDLEGMRIRQQLWEKIKDLPDGQQIEFRVDD